MQVRPVAGYRSVAGARAALLAGLVVLVAACGGPASSAPAADVPPPDATSTCTADLPAGAGTGARTGTAAGTGSAVVPAPGSGPAPFVPSVPTGASTGAAPTASTVAGPAGGSAPTVPDTTPVAWPVGATGPEVLAVQQRLATLGYWLGEATGVVTEDAVHAVVALQKVAGLERTGTVDAATRLALARGTAPVPRTTAGLVVEVDVTHQVLLLARDGVLVATLDTSTGRPGLETPVGTYTIYEAVDTADDGQGEYRPMFFYEPLALAIHGYESVPTVPYSHGCARLTLPAMDVLWANGVGVGTTVVVYA